MNVSPARFVKFRSNCSYSKELVFQPWTRWVSATSARIARTCWSTARRWRPRSGDRAPGWRTWASPRRSYWGSSRSCSPRPGRIRQRRKCCWRNNWRNNSHSNSRRQRPRPRRTTPKARRRTRMRKKTIPEVMFVNKFKCSWIALERMLDMRIYCRHVYISCIG